MSPEIKANLVKRTKSLAWRVGVAAVIAGLNELVKVVSGFGLPLFAVTGLGYVAGEVTKWLNNHSKIFGKALK